MILFAEGILYVYPHDDIREVVVKEINYQESLYWNKRFEAILGDVESIEAGDIILNRRFINDVAHWYLWRFRK